MSKRPRDHVVIRVQTVAHAEVTATSTVALLKKEAGSHGLCTASNTRRGTVFCPRAASDTTSCATDDTARCATDDTARCTTDFGLCAASDGCIVLPAQQ